MSEYIRLLEPPFRTWDLNTIFKVNKPNLREEREAMSEISSSTTTHLSLLLKVLVFLHLPTPSENLTFFYRWDEIDVCNQCCNGGGMTILLAFPSLSLARACVCICP